RWDVHGDGSGLRDGRRCAHRASSRGGGGAPRLFLLSAVQGDLRPESRAVSGALAHLTPFWSGPSAWWRSAIRRQRIRSDRWRPGDGASAITEERMNLELTDAVGLVTGASKGIGRAVALGLAAEGARVAVVARNAGALDKVAAECRDRSGREAAAVPADLSTLDEVERVVREARTRLGRIDILVNNAGAIRAGAFVGVPDAQWI